jgi:hypothetical protein
MKFTAARSKQTELTDSERQPFVELPNGNRSHCFWASSRKNSVQSKICPRILRWLREFRDCDARWRGSVGQSLAMATSDAGLGILQLFKTRLRNQRSKSCNRK